MRVAILGVGGVGAMAAWRLAKAGQEVVALEQFALDHDKGSSYGDSRIVRRVYPDTLYTSLMADAYPLWDELQHQSADEIFCRVGGIYFGKTESPLVHDAHNALATSHVPHDVLTAKEAGRRFPGFRFAPDETVVFEPSMGYARASQAVRNAARLARQHGAEIRENCPVAGIEPEPNDSGVRIQLRSGETLSADGLIIAPGAWASPLLAPLGLTLPLTVTRQPYVHLRPARNASDFEKGTFPVWIDAGANTYGFPHLGDVPGVKLGLHDLGTRSTPEDVLREVTAADIAPLLTYAKQRFPALSETVLYSKVCLYTSTPNEDFILDRVPGLPNTWLFSACSGHGFKFTPLMGELATRLVTGQTVPYDLTRFSLAAGY